MTTTTLATVTRGGLIESVHHGLAVIVAPDGAVTAAIGNPDHPIYARSALKPLQAVAMLRAGLELPPQLLALACASHSGEQRHVDGARAILATADLPLEALQNTPDLPYDEAPRNAWLAAGRGPESVVQNCSGKHAAMLVTCVRAGWPTENYLHQSHPLQQLIWRTVVELTGDQADYITVDGCGAPLFSSTLAGLARAFGAVAAGATPETAAICAAMNAHPEMVGGTGRDVTDLMAALPGVVTKDGAEGVQGLGLPDGRALAIKISDGAQRARPVVVAALLRHLGIDDPVLDRIGTVEVLGHGHPVGAVVATLDELR